MTSVFELFKIGIGPSSSHTVGPMVAAKRFIDEIGREALRPARIVAEIYGSLAWTGRGHSTDTAICLGLMGEAPATIDPNDVAALVHHVRETKRVPVRHNVVAAFDPARDIVFNMTDVLPGHSNGMRFSALDADGAVVSESVFYSIGGGFVVRDGEVESHKAAAEPHPFATGGELLRVCKPGGRIGLANWAPDGFIGQLFKTIGKHVPPPPGLSPPPLWGTEDRLRELFGDRVSIEATRRAYRFVYRSAEHFVGYFREYYGPTFKAFESLDARGQETLAGEIEELIRSWNKSGDETVVVPSYYLEVVARKS